MKVTANPKSNMDVLQANKEGKKVSPTLPCSLKEAGWDNFCVLLRLPCSSLSFLPHKNALTFIEMENVSVHVGRRQCIKF